ncbi:MAG: hypothetical protein Q8R28_15285 [Dehalococcoidia bacterium]|nr:hypothetical protein [Dehalococcoidia bacterium]
MKRDCPRCSAELEDGDEYMFHMMDHRMSEFIGQIQAVMRQSMLSPTAISIATSAAQTGMPVKEIMKLYREALKELMESGTVG